MFGRWKSKQTCSTRLDEDRLSQLPDSLICHILSHLPTKEAVKTSVLSIRWRDLWLLVSRLELDSHEFPEFKAFVSFGARFFHSDRVSYIHKLELSIYDTRYLASVDHDPSYLLPWIDASVKRKIQHLHVRCHREVEVPYELFYEMPLSLCVCESLVSLKLHMVALADAEFCSLPCLKTMCLKTVWYPNETMFGRLVSSCPVLEELEIATCVVDNGKVFRVLSRSLKKLAIRYFARIVGSETVIDAPKLCFLRIDGNLSENFMITNMDSNFKLDISLGFGLRLTDQGSKFQSFLLGISKVRDMTILRETFKLICEYLIIKPLPRFGNMSRLWVSFRVSHLKWLPRFLESCPNLKSLILECVGDFKKIPFEEEMNQISFSYVPECLSSSLEFVDFKVPIQGCAGDMKLVRYFLENSAILKKLNLYVDHNNSSSVIIFKELLRIPRGSTKCEVVVL
ncbi:putative FBD-associated F-box protein At5g53635 [Arabidopsis lyrata subsp. lyrata]|uniref:putative FBD-associated F-box protein At5g53635 n=1 Tax=Arabidopsis lyrata subsp. lyrata TaxID=81972 RepID=UPI000A29D0FC|nr:putative FBD-associated F-box protein At5g53635 [Arabidopsis lyrata subsp. lyrata]|eukprot:XP_020878710.1 putative FBD-associated F-box protein At5g53635 [Arabidopsis lyrata subsp. lyrata]